MGLDLDPIYEMPPPVTECYGSRGIDAFLTGPDASFVGELQAFNPWVDFSIESFRGWSPEERRHAVENSIQMCQRVATLLAASADERALSCCIGGSEAYLDPRALPGGE